ncbi:MAG: hypothetical protein IKP86_11545, partial [Anaerolineaceae bacterium]|nr:hypothetical protein [Anaerolineaceae bacterium]
AGEPAADDPSVPNAETETTASAHQEEPGSAEAAIAGIQNSGEPGEYPDPPEEYSPGSDEDIGLINGFFENFREFSHFTREYSSA